MYIVNIHIYKLVFVIDSYYNYFLFGSSMGFC